MRQTLARFGAARRRSALVFDGMDMLTRSRAPGIGGRYRIRRWYWISWACKCRWASCDRNHGSSQGQLPMSTIKAPGHRNLTRETVTVHL